MDIVLSLCVTVVYASCTATERKDLHLLVGVAQQAFKTDLANLDNV